MQCASTDAAMNTIDIKLVKEQLRLLGHTVDDAVILSFVKGLGAGVAAVPHAAEPDDDTENSTSIDDSYSSEYEAESGDDIQHSQDESVSPIQQQNGKAVFDPATNKLHAVYSSKQQSPQPPTEGVLSDASPSRSQLDQQSFSPQEDKISSPALYSTLDQRCRKFLGRLSERPSSQQLLQQHQVLASRELFPHSNEGAASQSPRGTDADSEYSDNDDDSFVDVQLATDLLHGCRVSSSTYPPLTDVYSRPATHSQMAAGGHLVSTTSTSGSSSADLESLLQLSRRSKEAATQPGQQQRQQPPASTTACALTQQTVPSAATPLSRLDEGSEVVYEAPGVPAHQELPRFGFRPGYKPIGIHFPPTLAPEAQQLIKETRGYVTMPPADAHAKPPLSPVASSPALQPHLAPWLDVRPCSESIIGEASLGGLDGHDAVQRTKRTSRDGTSSTDPLFHAPTSPTSPTPLVVPNNSRSPAKVIAQAAAAAAQAGRAAARPGKPQSLAALMPAPTSTTSSIRTSSKSGSSRDLSRQTSYSTATADNLRRPSSSSGLSSNDLYSQQLSFSGPRRRSTAVAPGVQKTDRVARFKQMQQQWQKDRFLSISAGSSSIRPSSSSRGNSLAARFAKLHAAQDMATADVLKTSRSRTQKAMTAATAYVPPTSQRRDGQRKLVRQAMQQHDD